MLSITNAFVFTFVLYFFVCLFFVQLKRNEIVWNCISVEKNVQNSILFFFHYCRSYSISLICSLWCDYIVVTVDWIELLVCCSVWFCLLLFHPFFSFCTFGHEATIKFNLQKQAQWQYLYIASLGPEQIQVELRRCSK